VSLMKFLKKIGMLHKAKKLSQFLAVQNSNRTSQIGWNKTGEGQLIIEETIRKDFIHWSAIQATQKIGLRQKIKIPGYWKVEKDFFNKVPKQLMGMCLNRTEDFIKEAQENTRKKGHDRFVIYAHSLERLEFEELDDKSFRFRMTIALEVSL